MNFRSIFFSFWILSATMSTTQAQYPAGTDGTFLVENEIDPQVGRAFYDIMQAGFSRGAWLAFSAKNMYEAMLHSDLYQYCNQSEVLFFNPTIKKVVSGWIFDAGNFSFHLAHYGAVRNPAPDGQNVTLQEVYEITSAKECKTRFTEAEQLTLVEVRDKAGIELTKLLHTTFKTAIPTAENMFVIRLPVHNYAYKTRPYPLLRFVEELVAALDDGKINGYRHYVFEENYWVIPSLDDPEGTINRMFPHVDRYKATSTGGNFADSVAQNIQYVDLFCTLTPVYFVDGTNHWTDRKWVGKIEAISIPAYPEPIYFNREDCHHVIRNAAFYELYFMEEIWRKLDMQYCKYPVDQLK